MKGAHGTVNGQLPKKITQLRKSAGGVLLNGMIRFLEPEKLEPILRAGYRRKGTSIPFAITAFGDILTWEDDKYICKVSFRHGKAEVMASGADYFFEDLDEDPQYAGKCFETTLFAEAVERLGVLSDTECYGFVPLEILGGPADVEHLEKVPYREHLQLLLQFGGSITQ